MKVGLIDPVGAKMGMNHYDDGLLSALAEKGYQAFLLSNYNSSYPAIHSKVFFKNVYTRGFASAINNLVGIIRSVFYCRKQKINAVLFHIFRGGLLDLFSLFLARLFSLKIILIVHDIETIDTSTNKFIKRIVLKYFHKAIVVHNSFSLQELKKFIGSEDIKNTFIIPHGNYFHAMGETFQQGAAIKKLNMDASDKHILFFGQIKKSKGLDVLLEAMHYSKSEFKLIIAGKLRIKSFDSYQSIINKYHLQNRIIKILNHVKEEEVPVLFAAADIVVVPYKVIYQSGVLLLAMSFGKVVIASDVPSFREIMLHGKNGVLFENKNSRDLAAKIDDCLNGNFNLEEIGINAKHHVETGFSWHNIAAEYDQLLSKL